VRLFNPKLKTGHRLAGADPVLPWIQGRPEFK